MKEWSEAEDRILLGGIRKYGIFKWSKIANILNRRPIDCKFRYDNFIKHAKSTKEAILNNTGRSATENLLLKKQKNEIQKNDILNSSSKESDSNYSQFKYCNKIINQDNNELNCTSTANKMIICDNSSNEKRILEKKENCTSYVNERDESIKIKILKLSRIFGYSTASNILKLTPHNCQNVYESLCLGTEIEKEKQNSRIEDQVLLEIARCRFSNGKKGKNIKNKSSR